MPIIGLRLIHFEEEALSCTEQLTVDNNRVLTIHVDWHWALSLIFPHLLILLHELNKTLHGDGWLFTHSNIQNTLCHYATYCYSTPAPAWHTQTNLQFITEIFFLCLYVDVSFHWEVPKGIDKTASAYNWIDIQPTRRTKVLVSVSAPQWVNI